MMRTDTNGTDSSRTQAGLPSNRTEPDGTEAPDEVGVSGADGERTAPVAPEPCSLYRFFDNDDVLLYVGITNNGVVLRSDR